MKKDECIKLVQEYNMTPNTCLHCGSPIYCTKENKLSQIKNKKFCNSSCSASYHNKGNVKNKSGINKKKDDYKNFLDKFSDEEIIDFFNSSNTLSEFSKKLGYKTSIDRRSKYICSRMDNL